MRQGDWLSVITVILIAAAPCYGDINPYPLPSTTTSTTGTNSTLLQNMQQQTQQALKIFQNVNYQKLSGNQDQQDFLSSGNEKQPQFTISGVQS